MKTLLFGVILCSQLHAAGEDYVNFIRQHQKTTGVVWSMPVQPEGEAPSQFPIEEGGALFQLWTIHQATTQDFLLDQKWVGAYLPSLVIAIETLDPQSVVPRTRADQPFTVSVNIAGLRGVTGLPEEAPRVLLEHHTAGYPGGQTTLPAAGVISGTPLSSAYIGINGTTTLTFPVTNLIAADPTKAAGEEHFVVDRKLEIRAQLNSSEGL